MKFLSTSWLGGMLDMGEGGMSRVNFPGVFHIDFSQGVRRWDELGGTAGRGRVGMCRGEGWGKSAKLSWNGIRLA